MTTAASAREVATGSAIEVAGATDRGTVRTENQDAWDATLVRAGASGDRASVEPTVTLVLADGMGGHSGGRESAEAAVQAAMAALNDGGSDRQLLEAAVHDANAAVLGVRDLIGGRPGTTLVLARVRGDMAWLANVGDSRAYLVRDGEARQVTEDHSWVGDEVRAGRLDAAAARRHPRRNIITRAVLGEAVDPDIFELRLSAGDAVLLCSDGIWEPLEDASIAQILSGDRPLVDCVARLCDAALDAGSSDNVTVVAARVRGQAALGYASGPHGT